MKNITQLFYLVLILLFTFSSNTIAQSLTKKQENGKYGVVNSSGKTIVPIQYQRVNIYDFCIIAREGKAYKIFATDGKPYFEGIFQKIEVYPNQGYI